MSFFKRTNINSNNSDSSRSANSPLVGVQAKLNIGKSYDQYENEADRMTDKIVNKSGIVGTEASTSPSPKVQKKGTEEVQKQEETEQIQEKPLLNERTPLIQTRSVRNEELIQGKSFTAAGTHASSSVENRINQSKGSGNKLDGKTKNEMESGFGNDFSNVNIHNDDRAAQLSQDLGAKAFTHGNDVYFNKGQYNPESSEGKHLLAHELTHTIQQKGMVQKKEDNTSKASLTVEPEFDVEIGFNAFIPNTLSAPVYEDNRAWKPEPSPFSDKLFASDNRNYNEKGTSRIWQKGFLRFKGEQIINRVSQQGVGASEQADPIYKILGYTPIHYGSDTGGNPIKQIVGIKNKKSKTAADKGSVTKIEKEGIKGFQFIGEASYPFSSMAPDIDFDISALVKVFKKDDQYFLMAILVGVRDEFPAYQAYLSAGGTTHYFYTYRVDKTDGPGLINPNSTDFIVASKLIKLS